MYDLGDEDREFCGGLLEDLMLLQFFRDGPIGVLTPGIKELPKTVLLEVAGIKPDGVNEDEEGVVSANLEDDDEDEAISSAFV